jgi:lycopene beta-cyclase
MPTDNTFGKVDFLFVGGGASATLLLLSMEKNGLLANNKVVVIDPDLKLKNDKTFCFWTNKSEQPSLLCAPFISKEWNSFRGQQDKIETEKTLR